MSLKGMSKKEQHQVLVACGLDYALAPSATASSESGAPSPPPSLHPSLGPSLGPSLDAAKQVAGKGLKVVSEEMRRAFKG
jgi:hypothetical protein